MQNHVHEILPRLYLGDYIASSHELFLKERKISFIVNVTKHIPNYFEATGEIEYIQIPVEDNLEPTEIQELYRQAVEWIPQIDAAYMQNPEQSILFHCHAGQQRSAALMVMFMMYHFQKKTHRPYASRDAIFYVTSKRPVAFQGGRYINFQEAIQRYEAYVQTLS